MGVYLKEQASTYVPSPINVADNLYNRERPDIANDPDVLAGENDSKEEFTYLTSQSCSAIMSYNVHMRWTGATVVMPFRTPNGPSRGAHVDASLNGIVFDEPGTWTVHALLNGNGSDGPGSNELQMFVRVFNAGGALQAEKIIRSSPGINEQGLSMTQPFLVNAGWYVQVAGRSGRPRWWPGGAKWSGLSVVKTSDGNTGGAPDDATDDMEIDGP